MKKIYLLLEILFSVQIAAGQNSPNDYVNVFVGTSNSRWMLFPGPTMPFGMVKLSPDYQGNVRNGEHAHRRTYRDDFIQSALLGRETVKEPRILHQNIGNGVNSLLNWGIRRIEEFGNVV